jgi:hypothetical protein
MLAERFHAGISRTFVLLDLFLLFVIRRVPSEKALYMAGEPSHKRNGKNSAVSAQSNVVSSDPEITESNKSDVKTYDIAFPFTISILNRAYSVQPQGSSYRKSR